MTTTAMSSSFVVTPLSSSSSSTVIVNWFLCLVLVYLLIVGLSISDHLIMMANKKSILEDWASSVCSSVPGGGGGGVEGDDSDVEFVQEFKGVPSCKEGAKNKKQRGVGVGVNKNIKKKGSQVPTSSSSSAVKVKLIHSQEVTSSTCTPPNQDQITATTDSNKKKRDDGGEGQKGDGDSQVSSFDPNPKTCSTPLIRASSTTSPSLSAMVNIVPWTKSGTKLKLPVISANSSQLHSNSSQLPLPQQTSNARDSARIMNQTPTMATSMSKPQSLSSSGMKTNLNKQSPNIHYPHPPVDIADRFKHKNRQLLMRTPLRLCQPQLTGKKSSMKRSDSQARAPSSFGIGPKKKAARIFEFPLATFSSSDDSESDSDSETRQAILRACEQASSVVDEGGEISTNRKDSAQAKTTDSNAKEQVRPSLEVEPLRPVPAIMERQKVIPETSAVTAPEIVREQKDASTEVDAPEMVREQKDASTEFDVPLLLEQATQTCKIPKVPSTEKGIETERRTCQDFGIQVDTPTPRTECTTCPESKKKVAELEEKRTKMNKLLGNILKLVSAAIDQNQEQNGQLQSNSEIAGDTTLDLALDDLLQNEPTESSHHPSADCNFNSFSDQDLLSYLGIGNASTSTSTNQLTPVPIPNQTTAGVLENRNQNQAAASTTNKTSSVPRSSASTKPPPNPIINNVQNKENVDPPGKHQQQPQSGHLQPQKPQARPRNILPKPPAPVRVPIPVPNQTTPTVQIQFKQSTSILDEEDDLNLLDLASHNLPLLNLLPPFPRQLLENQQEFPNPKEKVFRQGPALRRGRPHKEKNSQDVKKNNKRKGRKSKKYTEDYDTELDDDEYDEAEQSIYRCTSPVRVQPRNPPRTCPYKCPLPQCKKSYVNEYSLKQHSLAHQGLTTCKYCKYVYSCEYGLRKHLERTETECSKKHAAEKKEKEEEQRDKELYEKIKDQLKENQKYTEN